MDDWVVILGIVQRGYGVASGKGGDRRFPQGTIAMQKPFFAAQGLNLDAYFPGTINVAISPYHYQIKQSKYTFRTLQWCLETPAEDFSFFDCRLIQEDGKNIDGLIYYPHPETKPEHFQDAQILELLMPFIPGLDYGDRLMIAIAKNQIEIATDFGNG